MEQNDAPFTPDDEDYEVIYDYAPNIADMPISNWASWFISCDDMNSGWSKAERMFVLKASNSTRCAIEKMMRVTK